MKQILRFFAALFLFIPFTVNAQKDYFEVEHFLLKGNIKNYPHQTFLSGSENYLDDFFEQKIEVNSNGYFEALLPIQHKQIVGFMFQGDPTIIRFTAQAGDTIYINGDYKNLANSLSIQGSNSQRTAEINAFIKQERIFINNYPKASDAANNFNVTPEKLYELVNNLFNEHISFLIDSIRGSLNKEAYSNLCQYVYYSYADVLQKRNLAFRYNLKLNSVNATKDTSRLFFDEINRCKILSATYFWNISSYRELLTNSFVDGMFVMFEHEKEITIEDNSTLNAVHRVLGNVIIPSIREVLLTKILLSAAKHYSMDKVNVAYIAASDYIKHPYLINELKKVFVQAQKISKGNPAPAFSLKNDKGEIISLSSLKGKLVYIDFWGVKCAPCIHHIKNFAPALRKRYQNKNIVFVNICVDTDSETVWKENINKLKLTGINLFAPGWTENKVCKDYLVNGIPHYVLIDKKGNMVESSAKSPDLLLSDKNNIIDQLLSSK